MQIECANANGGGRRNYILGTKVLLFPFFKGETWREQLVAAGMGSCSAAPWGLGGLCSAPEPPVVLVKKGLGTARERELIQTNECVKNIQQHISVSLNTLQSTPNCIFFPAYWS